MGFSRNESFGHSALDSYRKEEIAEEVEEQGYEETVREDLDHLFAELDKQPHNAKILGYIESTKEILARLENEIKAEGTESLANLGRETKTEGAESLSRLGENQFKTTETSEKEDITRLDEKPNEKRYVDKDRFEWTSRENAIQNDDDRYNR